MKTWQDAIVLMLVFVTGVCGSACVGDCDEESHRVESGQYVILNRYLGTLDWLAHGQMNIDLPAETTTLRYTRDGATYEVTFTLKK